MTIVSPKVIIEVAGGVVHACYSDIPIRVDILDHDDWDTTTDQDAVDKYEELDEEAKILTSVY